MIFVRENYMKYPLNYISYYHPSSNAYILKNILNLIRLKKRLKINEIKVLDIGFGVGYFLFEASKRKLMLKGFGVDTNKKSVIFVKKIAKKNRKKIYFEIGDGYNLPFYDDTFHVVICSHVLEHVKEPEKILKEIYRVLKKNGEVWIGTPSKNYDSLPKLSTILNMDVTPKDHIVPGFNLEEMDLMLSSIGFHIIEKKYVGQFFGLFFHDISGIIGELRGMSTSKIRQSEPKFDGNLIQKILFIIRRKIAKFLAMLYRLDNILWKFKGSKLFVKGRK